MENKTFLDRLESINEQLNLTHYWIILLKYKRILFITPILIAVLGYLIALNINPIFQSSATLVIEESVKNIVDIEEVYGGGEVRGGLRSSNYINNQIQILESDEVIGSILANKEEESKILELYQKIPERFFVRNLKAKITFLVLYKQKLFALNFSATQELDRQLQEQIGKNNALHQDMEEYKQTIDDKMDMLLNQMTILMEENNALKLRIKWLEEK